MYTRAQLRLMACDVTVTVYKAMDRESHHDGKYHKPDKEKMEEAYRKWKLRKARGELDLKKFLPRDGAGQPKR